MTLVNLTSKQQPNVTHRCFSSCTILLLNIHVHHLFVSVMVKYHLNNGHSLYKTLCINYSRIASGVLHFFWQLFEGSTLNTRD